MCEDGCVVMLRRGRYGSRRGLSYAARVALLICVVLLSTCCLYQLGVVVGAVPNVLTRPGSKTCSAHQIRNAQVGRQQPKP
jgi:hypothetical protein